MVTDITAEARHSVHHASNSTGWNITSITLIKPNGPTASPNRTTTQGMVRNLLGPPTTPPTASNRKPKAASAAAGKGRTWEMKELRILTLPSPKKGSHTWVVPSSWYKDK